MKRAKFFLSTFLLIILLSSISFAIPTIVVEETDLVKIEVDTFDLDGDNITVVYSAPLNKNGEWKTDYGDAGNYTTLVTATDGKSLTEEEFSIIVKKKNQAPLIKVQDHVIGEETEVVDLGLEVIDPNNDKVSFEISDPFNKDGEWLTNYEDAGEYTVTIRASDGELDSTRIIKVTVIDKNRAPEAEFSPEQDVVEMYENEIFNFEVSATDADTDEIVYLWELDGEVVAWETGYTYSADYESAGTHNLKLVISDGIDENVKEWQIEVYDVNRAPELPDFDEIYAKEGQKLELNLPLTDADGDGLFYVIDEPFGEDLVWEIGYDEAGEYEIDIEVSDGLLTESDTIEITVEDIDRAPEFTELIGLGVNETDELKINLEATDPDGDEIYFAAYGFPEGAVFEGDELIWQPDYDFVSKPNSFFVRLLSRLRLDKYLWQKKDLEITFSACGRELCTNQTVDVTVHDVNRMPELWVADKVTINETDKIRLKPTAADPDGDVVKFYFTEPLNRKGEWQPDFDGQGEYDVTVGATDGEFSVEKAVKIIVNNLNRQPELNDIKDREVNEGEEVWIKVDAQDPDNDELELWVESSPEGSSFKDQWFSWIPGHDVVNEKKGWLHDLISNYAWLNRHVSQEKQYFGVNFVVSDGDFIVSRLVDIAVRNWNAPPEIVNATPESIQAYVGEPIVFAVDAVDVDGDELDYKWDFGFMNGGVEDATAISRKFTSPGTKRISLTISDGRDSIEKEWTVNVKQKVVQEVIKQQPTIQPTFTSYVV